jgi:hypothetical protein
MTIDAVELSYTLELLPAGRVPFRRWRWELWQGPQLIAAGWRLHPLHAQHALRAYSSRYAHQLHGVHPLRPDATRAPETEWRARAVTLECGELRVRLTPRTPVHEPTRLQPASS